MRRFLPGTEPPVQAAPGGDAALVALLVRAARANADYNPLQIAEIDSVIARRFGLGPWEGAALRRRAEALEADTGDTVHLTRALKAFLPRDARREFLRDLWSVILADGHRHDDEAGLMRLVSSLIGLRDRDSAHARQDIQARMAASRDQSPLAR